MPLIKPLVFTIGLSPGLEGAFSNVHSEKLKKTKK